MNLTIPRGTWVQNYEIVPKFIKNFFKINFKIDKKTSSNEFSM